MEEREYTQLRMVLTYLVVFAVVAATAILRFNDKISSDLTGVIFGFIVGVMMTILGSILGSLQKDLLEKE